MKQIFHRRTEWGQAKQSPHLQNAWTGQRLHCSCQVLEAVKSVLDPRTCGSRRSCSTAFKCRPCLSWGSPHGCQNCCFLHPISELLQLSQSWAWTSSILTIGRPSWVTNGVKYGARSLVCTSDTSSCSCGYTLEIKNPEDVCYPPFSPNGCNSGYYVKYPITLPKILQISPYLIH